MSLRFPFSQSAKSFHTHTAHTHTHTVSIYIYLHNLELAPAGHLSLLVVSCHLCKRQSVWVSNSSSSELLRWRNMAGNPPQQLLRTEIPNRWTHSGYVLPYRDGQLMKFLSFGTLSTGFIDLSPPVFRVSAPLPAIATVVCVSGFRDNVSTSFQNNLMSKSQTVNV
jgi:hypothetical protein